MKVNFRSNDCLSKKLLGRERGAEVWLQSLDKYLTEEAVLDLTLENFAPNKSYATLNIIDSGVHIHVKSDMSDSVTAINEVIAKAGSQLLKCKTKLIKSRRDDSIIGEEQINIFNKHDFVDINDGFETIKLEKELEREKETTRYKNSVNKFVNYLYDIDYIDTEIKRLENQLALLYGILDNEINTMLYVDVILLVESIEKLKQNINLFIYVKNNYKMNIRDERYIDEAIEKELHLLSLKRK